MTDNAEFKDITTRTIVLVYGLLEDGGPFWLYAAVKPSKYNGFMAAQKDGSLNVYDFSPFGEIIIAGKGKSPPDEVTLKVAEMYQTDPATLFVPQEAQGDVPEEMKPK